MEGLSVVREIKREEKSFGGGEWEGKGESLEQKKVFRKYSSLIPSHHNSV